MNWYKKIEYKIAFRYPIQWSNEDLQSIKELLQKGYSFGDVASLMGVSAKTIGNLNNLYKWMDFSSMLGKEKITENKRKKMENFWSDPDNINKSINRWKDPKYREKQEKAHEKTYSDPEYRKNMSDRQLEIWKDPQYREKQEKAREKTRSDPAYREYRKNMSDRQVELWKQRGGLNGFLLSRPSREKAIEFLNNFYSFLVRSGQDKNETTGVYNKYKQIIDNHTYPEDLPQKAKY